LRPYWLQPPPRIFREASHPRCRREHSAPWRSYATAASVTTCQTRLRPTRSAPPSRASASDLPHCRSGSLLVGFDRQERSRPGRPSQPPLMRFWPLQRSLVRARLSVGCHPSRTIPLRRFASLGIGKAVFLRPTIQRGASLRFFASLRRPHVLRCVQRSGSGHASPPSSVDVPLPVVPALTRDLAGGFCSGGAHGVRPFAGLIRRADGGSLSRSSGPTCR